MWSRFTVVVRQAPHWQVRLRLLVLLRPTWRSQTWSCVVLLACAQVGGARKLGVDLTSCLYLHRVIRQYLFARRSLATGRSGCRRCLTVSLMEPGLAATVALPVVRRSLLVQLARQSEVSARPSWWLGDAK